MKAAIFSNHSPRVGFGVDRKMDVSRSQVMVVAASRNHHYRTARSNAAGVRVSRGGISCSFGVSYGPQC